jgi:predicted PolB exonuclease-like 3'-5' exonuclease
MNILTYSLITLPDFATGSILHDLHNLDDKGIAKALFHLQAQQTGHENLPSYLQQIIAISMILTDEKGKQQTMTLKEQGEVDILNTFFDIIENYNPTLVTWDDDYFNSEVIHYRSIKHTLQMSPHYENKVHHFNLNTAMISSTAKTSLEEIAIALGLDAQEKRESRVICEQYLAEEHDDLYTYCENNVLNIYQIYLRYQLSHGEIDKETYQQLIAMH